MSRGRKRQNWNSVFWDGNIAISVAFVCPSVYSSVAYIANNSRTQRPSVPKFGRKVPHLWCNSHTSFKVRRWKDKVTRPINADTHRVPYFPNGKAYEHQTWYTDGGRRPTLARGTMTSKVKGQGRKVTWTVWAVLAQCCSCVIRSGLGHTVSAKPGGHTFCYIFVPVAWILTQHDPKYIGPINSTTPNLFWDFHYNSCNTFPVILIKKLQTNTKKHMHMKSIPPQLLLRRGD